MLWLVSAVNWAEVLPTATPTGFQVFTHASLCSKEASHAEELLAFRAALRRDSVVLLKPAEAERDAIASLASFGASFFALDSEVQARFGPLQESEPSDAHRGQSLPFGSWRSTYEYGRQVKSRRRHKLSRTLACR